MSEGKAARKLGFIFFHVFNPRIPPRSDLWAYESQEKIPRWKLKTFDTSMPKALCQTRSRAGNLPYRDVDARGNFVGRREEEPRFIMLDDDLYMMFDDLWWFKAKVKGVKGQKSKCLKALWKVPYQQRLELIVRWVDWVPGRCIKSCDISDISIKGFRQKFRRTGNTCQNQLRNKRWWQKTGNIPSNYIKFHLIPSDFSIWVHPAWWRAALHHLWWVHLVSSLDDHAFFSAVVKGNERLLDSQPVKCDVNVIFYVFFLSCVDSFFVSVFCIQRCC